MCLRLRLLGQRGRVASDQRALHGTLECPVQHDVGIRDRLRRESLSALAPGALELHVQRLEYVGRELLESHRPDPGEHVGVELHPVHGHRRGSEPHRREPRLEVGPDGQSARVHVFVVIYGRQQLPHGPLGGTLRNVPLAIGT